MDTLKFRFNWNNKLGCKVFTTFRIYNPLKHYVGNTFRIIPPEKQLELLPFNASIIIVKTCHLSNVQPAFAFIDTSYNKDEFQKIVRTMYKNHAKPVDEIVFAMLFLRKEKYREKST